VLAPVRGVSDMGCLDMLTKYEHIHMFGHRNCNLFEHIRHW
jgi:hypothetical protein